MTAAISRCREIAAVILSGAKDPISFSVGILRRSIYSLFKMTNVLLASSSKNCYNKKSQIPVPLTSFGYRAGEESHSGLVRLLGEQIGPFRVSWVRIPPPPNERSEWGEERANCFARGLDEKAAAMCEFALSNSEGQGEHREKGMKSKLLYFSSGSAKQKFPISSEAR